MAVLESNEQVRHRLLKCLKEMEGQMIVEGVEALKIKQGIICSLSDSYKMDEEAMLDFAAHESGEERGFFLEEGEKEGLSGEELEEFADELESKKQDEIVDAIEEDPFCYFVSKAMLTEEEFKKDKRFKKD